MATRKQNANPFRKMSTDQLKKLQHELTMTHHAITQEIYRRMDYGEAKTFMMGKNKRDKGFGFMANEQ